MSTVQLLIGVEGEVKDSEGLSHPNVKEEKAAWLPKKGLNLVATVLLGFSLATLVYSSIYPLLAF